MYESDLTDVAEIGWDRFISGIWESIFVGYRVGVIRTIARRWSDLLQAGIGCSEEIADDLVRVEVMVRQDRDLLTIRDPEELLAGMFEVLADMGADLSDASADAVLAPIRPSERAQLLAAHEKLSEYLRDGMDGPEAADP